MLKINNKRMELLFFVTLVLGAHLSIGSASALDYQEFRFEQGETKAIWLGYAMHGTVHLAIASEFPDSKVEAWWIVLPWGNMTPAIPLQGTASLNIPWYGVGARLRVHASRRTVIRLSEQASVQTFSFSW